MQKPRHYQWHIREGSSENSFANVYAAAMNRECRPSAAFEGRFLAILHSFFLLLPKPSRPISREARYSIALSSTFPSVISHKSCLMWLPRMSKRWIE